MGDLILRTRLDTLETNLLRVQQVLQAVQQRREEVEKLYAHLSCSMETALQVQREIERATTDLRAIERATTDLRASDTQRLACDLAGAEQQIGKVIEALRTAQDEIVLPMRTRLVHIDEQEDLGLTVNIGLVRGSESSLKELAKIHAHMHEAAEQENKEDPQAAQTLRRQAWQEYTGQMAQKTQPIFAEYVDFLRGLALREAGFDAGICCIADELIRLTEKKGHMPRWQSFTILAREEDVELKLARIIRLRFPEWSIWTLPLVAYEFGYLVSTEAQELCQFVQRETTLEWPAAHLQHYLADAFATYAMGPAYAYAAILLRFNPHTAFADTPGQPAAIRRVHVILSMLDWMSYNDRPAAPPYLPIIESLRQEWDAALGQVTATIPLDDAATARLQQQKQILYEWAQEPLSDDVVKQRAQERGKLQEWVQFLGNLLHNITLVGYSVAAWENIATWPDKLLQDGDIGMSGSEDLRDVLNAAWLSRLQLQSLAQTGAVAQADEKRRLMAVAQAAEKLWQRILNPPVKRGPSSIGAQISPTR